jgi:beta-phosphoglucomutase-like phosphatase (HAD superfamily)
MNIRCFIFDLDGTLVFNEKANLLAYQAAFETVGLELTENDFSAHFRNGGGIEDIFRDYTRRYGLVHDPKLLKTIRELKIKEYADRVHLIEQNATTIGLLQALAPHHHIALATTASEKNARTVLNTFKLERFFDYMVFAEDVQAKKPDPECHFKIAKHFGVEPKECIIFEDSPSGIEAAEAFGGHICKVVR